MINKIQNIIKTNLNPHFKTNQGHNYQIYRKIIQANMPKLELLEGLVENALRKRGFTRHFISKIYEQIENIDPVMEVCSVLQQFILAEIESTSATCDKKDLELVHSLNIGMELEDALNEWVMEEYPLIDRREIKTEDVKVRRFDSLARILASQTMSISVCGAVTIDTSETSNPRLIVSGNLSGANVSVAFLREFSHKIKILKGFYTEYKDQKLDSLSLFNRSKELCNLLFPKRKPPVMTFTEAPEEEQKLSVLEQAVYKVTHSLFSDSKIFSPAEKDAFLETSTVILLLPYIANSQLGMSIHEMKSGDINKSKSMFPFPGHLWELKNIHAEQLIVLYLHNVIKVPMDVAIIIGISKLCCITCDRVLARFSNVITRGQHNQGYPYVIDLMTGEREKPPITAPGPTYAQPSPSKSPEKGANDAQEGERAFGLQGGRANLSQTVCTRLFCDAPKMPVDGEEDVSMMPSCSNA